MNKVKHSSKRWLAIFVSVLMCMNMLSVTAFAETNEDLDPDEEFVQPDAPQDDDPEDEQPAEVDLEDEDEDDDVDDDDVDDDDIDDDDVDVDDNDVDDDDVDDDDVDGDDVDDDVDDEKCAVCWDGDAHKCELEEDFVCTNEDCPCAADDEYSFSTMNFSPVSNGAIRLMAAPAAAPASETSVTSEEELVNAIKDAEDSAVITVSGEFSLTEKLEINKTLTLDLGGNTINGNVSVGDGGNLTVTGGSGKITSSGSTIQVASGGSLTVSGGEVEATGMIAILAQDGSEVKISGDGKVKANIGAIIAKGNSEVSISGGKVETTDNMTVVAQENSQVSISSGKVKAANTWAVVAQGNSQVSISGGEVGETKDMTIAGQGTSKVTISGGKIEATASDGTAIFLENSATLIVNKENGVPSISGVRSAVETNGNTSTGVTINISAGTFSADSWAIYLPAGKLTVDGTASITGGSGIITRGAELTINGGTITATGTDNGVKITHDYLIPRAAVAIDKNTNYNGGNVKVAIDGGTFEAPPAAHVLVFTVQGEVQNTAEAADISITGGKFQGDTTNLQSLIADTGYTMMNGEVVPTTQGSDSVARVGEDGYFSSLKAALDAVKENGGTVTLLETEGGIALNEQVTIKGNVTLDLNGQTVKVGLTAASLSGVPFIVEGGTLTIQDNSKDGKGLIDHSNGNYFTIKAGDSSKPADPAFGGTVNIQGGTIKGAAEGSGGGISVIRGYAGSAITVSGGAVEAIDGYGVGLSGKDASLNATGGTIKGNIAASINGNAGNETAKITVNGGILLGSETASGIYQANGIVNVISGTVEGGTGILVRALELSISGGTIRATGEGDISVGDAYNDDGDRYGVKAAAVAIDKNGSYGKDAKDKVTLKISGGNFEGALDLNVSDTGDSSAAVEGVSISVTGGTFSDDSALDYVPNGKTLVKNAAGKYVVGDATPATTTPSTTPSTSTGGSSGGGGGSSSSDRDYDYSYTYTAPTTTPATPEQPANPAAPAPAVTVPETTVPETTTPDEPAETEEPADEIEIPEADVPLAPGPVEEAPAGRSNIPLVVCAVLIPLTILAIWLVLRKKTSIE